MKWGVRRFQNKDGSLTPKGRTRSRSRDKKQMTEAEKKARKAKVKKIAIAAALTAAAIGTGVAYSKMHKKNKNALDSAHKKLDGINKALASTKINKSAVDAAAKAANVPLRTPKRKTSARTNFTPLYTVNSSNGDKAFKDFDRGMSDKGATLVFGNNGSHFRMSNGSTISPDWGDISLKRKSVNHVRRKIK